MERKQLEELGLDEEQVNGVMKMHGKSINDYKDKAGKVETLESQIEDYQQQLKDRDEQLTDLQKKASDSDELSKEIQRLKDENESKDKEYQQQLEAKEKDFQIEKALRDANARHPDLIKNALQTDDITVKDGKLIGFDEQMSQVKEKYADLFEEPKPDGIEKRDKLKGQDPHPSDPNKGKTGITKEQFSKMGYKDRAELYQEQPDLYNQLSQS